MSERTIGLGAQSIAGHRTNNSTVAALERRPSRTLLMCASVLATVQLTQAADSVSATETAQLDEIIVTAQRRTERLQDVPVSVSVISGETLERANVRSLQDLSNREPNFQIVQTPGGDQMMIRGTGSGTNSGFEQSVGTFVDGLYRSRARSARIALFDVDRVEVLKGPQTTFFGANAIAGALNITTRKPTDAFQANTSALYAFEDGEYNFEGGVGGPVADGINLRIAARLNGMDGYIHNDKLGGEGPHNRDGQLRLSGNFQPSSVLTIDARFDYARLRGTQTEAFGELVGCPPAIGSPAPSCASSLAQFGGQIDDNLNYRAASAPSFSNLDLYEGGVTARLDIGEASVTSTTGYFQQKYANQATSPFPGFDALGTIARYGELAEPFRQISQELRIQSEGAGRLQYIAGIYYEEARLSPQFVTASNARPLGALPALVAVGYSAQDAIGYERANRQESQTSSAFGSLKFAVTDQLNLTGSLRYSNVKKETTNLGITFGHVLPNSAVLVPGTPTQQAAIATQFGNVAPAARIYPFNEKSDSDFMPSVNVQYKFTPDTMAYVSYTRGFKAGGFSASSNGTFDPEFVDAYEAGLKAQFFDRRLQANVALYRSDYTNLQVSQIIAQPNGLPSITLITNAAESRSDGVEIGLVARPTSRLNISTEVAYLNSRYISYPSTACYAVQADAQGCITTVANGVATRSQSLSGRTRPLAPHWSGNVDASYSASLGNALDLTYGGTVYFKSSYLIAPSLNPISRQEGYTKVDLRLTLGSAEGRWSVGVIARNVFDEQTIQTADDLPGATGSYGILLDRPRSIAIAVNRRF
jgi:outer membrane receptor protein involved in Fe transport